LRNLKEAAMAHVPKTVKKVAGLIQAGNIEFINLQFTIRTLFRLQAEMSAATGRSLRAD
jgi:hypothetical protein